MEQDKYVNGGGGYSNLLDYSVFRRLSPKKKQSIPPTAEPNKFPPYRAEWSNTNMWTSGGGYTNPLDYSDFRRLWL